MLVLWILKWTFCGQLATFWNKIAELVSVSSVCDWRSERSGNCLPNPTQPNPTQPNLPNAGHNNWQNHYLPILPTNWSPTTWFCARPLHVNTWHLFSSNFVYNFNKNTMVPVNVNGQICHFCSQEFVPISKFCVND